LQDRTSRDLKFFSVANAVLSGVGRSLDFCSTFDQAKVEKENSLQKSLMVLQDKGRIKEEKTK